MDKSFKTLAADYFRAFRLSKGQMCRLNRLQAAGCARRRPTWFSGISLMHAAMVVLVAVGAWLGWQHYQQGMQVKRLVAEIVYNHNKQMVMEIETDSLERIERYLAKLDFPLIAPQQLPSDQWLVLGGRYCSLGGQLAAQLKLRRTGTDKVYTLFQTTCAPGVLAKAALGRRYIDGVEVQLWSERGLLLGMAGGR